MSSLYESSKDTIVALSSGNLPSGVAVIRISGPACGYIEDKLFDVPLVERRASVRKLLGADRVVLDQVLAIKFEEHRSFTGEDVIEVHAHGGQAVVAAILSTLCGISGVRLAEAGEFTRRAFENGRLDLTEVDGIADLVAAETEAQRKLALQQSQGELRNLYSGWRKELIHIRAMIEAEFDFADEEDVPTDISEAGFERLNLLIDQIEGHLADGRSGEIIRDGYKIALMGKPNAGKSSLLNALAKRDVAIVSDEAGTTRDVIDVRLDIGGYAVNVFDTAGIRETKALVESEGMRRAHLIADVSDLVLWLTPVGEQVQIEYSGETPVLRLVSKDDDGRLSSGSVSVLRSDGLDWLLDELANRLGNLQDGSHSVLITRQRYREALDQAKDHLVIARDDAKLDLEIRADELRRAGDCIGRITGAVDIEDLLDVIFAEFCVGK